MITFLTQEVGEDLTLHFTQAFQISHAGVITIMAIILAVAIALYVLRSIGVYVLAKRQDVKHAFLAWIPFVWIYPVCLIIGKVRIFGNTFKRLALLFTILFCLAEVITLVTEIISYYPLMGNLLIGNKEIFVVDAIKAFKESAHYEIVEPYHFATGYGIFHYSDGSFIYPFSNATEVAILKALDIMGYFSLVFDIASIVITINVYIALFRKFWPQHFILATVLSFLGLFSPFVFAIRKKEEINYQEYLQARYNARYGMYGAPYGNSYGNPYQGGAQRQTPPDNPFSEFAERGEVDPGDPFKEFSEDKEPFSEFDKDDKDE